MTSASNTNNLAVFLHLPEGDRLYVCIVDEKRRAFDFTDNTFKSGSKLAHVRDACLPATGRHEPRADHEYSYRVEIDLSRLIQGTNPETIPAEGAKVTVHWLRQVGDEPDVSADTQLTNTVSLQNVGGRFQPANKWDADRLDENREFTQREKFAAEYRDFVLREIDTQDARRERLATAVRSGNVAGVLRVLAEDICNWAGNLKQHLLHQISHLAKDPSFVQTRMVPKDAPFQVYETWAVRDWIGCHEAYDLIEFHKSADFARSFSARLDRLHEARVEFCRNVVDYTVQTRGEDVEGVFVLDEARKELKHQAIWLAEYIDVIALQFEAANEAKTAPTVQAGSEIRDEALRPHEPSTGNTSKATDTVLLEKFAAALGAYTGVLNQIVIEANHPEIESVEDAIKWTTSRQTDLKVARERVERLAGKELVAEVVAPEGASSEQWMVQLLAMVAEGHNAISYVFTSGPPQATSDDPRAKMAASVVSRQLETASNLVRDMESRRRVILATAQARRTTRSQDESRMREESPMKTVSTTSAEARLPFSMRTAYGNLSSALTEAIELYRRTLRFPNSAPVIDAVERFVHELQLVPNHLAELERRVHLVETACAAGSEYSTARTAALASYSATPQQLCRGKLALDRLRGESTANPQFVSEVIEARKSIEAVLEEPSLGLSAAATDAFAAWRNVCRKIQQGAERLEVDGCWHLYHVYRAADPAPPERSQVAHAILQTNMGGANLDMILAAAESLVAWAAEEQLSSGAMPDNTNAKSGPVVNETSETPPESKQFSGGEIVFYEDRVQICGANICSGPRSGSKRIVLELLSRRKNGKSFNAYSGEELETEAKKNGAKGSPAGWIRDLRDDIVESLRNQSNIISGHKDVILSGEVGYRFAECLTVRYDSPPGITDITDTAEPADVRDDDVRDVFDVRDDEATRRRAWIIQQLQGGVQLKAPMVKAQFKRSAKTAQRDLDALRDEGKIEFVGDPRTGYYHLVAGK